jgi:hypothetical protein
MVKRDEFIIIFKNEEKQFKFDLSNFQHMRNNYGNYTFLCNNNRMFGTINSFSQVGSSSLNNFNKYQ